jgi:voltage-gated potassium channel Kch
VRALYARLLKYWNEDRSLTALLIYLVIEIFVVPLVTRDTLWQPILQAVFYSLILLSGVFSVASYRYQFWTTFTLAAVAFIVQLTSLFWPSDRLTVVSLASSVTFLSVLAVMVLVHVFSEGEVNFHRIRGGIAVYLIIGTVLANAYYMIELLDPASFTSAIPGVVQFTRWEFMYFSFVTLTTLGYGDVLPVSQTAQSLTMAEGLIGQLLPVVLIARLVSLEIEHRRQRRLKA